MKTALKLLALAMTVTVFSSAFAGDGPAIATLVPIDESKYDIANKQFVEKSDVMNKITKDVFVREIYAVKEKYVPFKYVVLEDRSAYVVVNTQAAQKWVYQNR
jgi:hypothetical protein